MDVTRETSAEKAAFGIANALHSYSRERVSTETIVITAYLLYEAGKQDREVSFQSVMDGALGTEPEVLEVGRSALTEGSWDMLVRANYSQADLRNVILYTNYDSTKDGIMPTPSSLVDLAEGILSVHPGERVADIGCGYGSFVIGTVKCCPQVEVHGYEIVRSVSVIASIRARLLGEKVSIHCCDALSLLSPEGEQMVPAGGFDKIFANLPFGFQGKRYMDTPSVRPVVDRFPSLLKAGSADWFFSAVVTELLAENGKAAYIMTNGSLWNAVDKAVRKQFLDRGLVEAVIALPANLFMTTSIPVSLVVFSRGNQAVRMVDATGLYEQGRRQNVLGPEHLDVILDAYQADSDESRLVYPEEIRDNDYSLYPGRYIAQFEEIEDGVAFSEIIQDISRGSPATAKELDEMTSLEPTDCQYLSLSNLHDGIIDSDLPYLKKIATKLDKYCLRNGTLILSKIGFPFKVGVASVKEDQKILANGNLYIINLDENKADPVYVQAYLESDQGQTRLKAAASGAVMMSIGADVLKSIVIPLPPLEKQKKVREAYLAAQKDFREQKKRLEEAQNRLAHVFDTERKK